jgi:hypothetical protein
MLVLQIVNKMGGGGGGSVPITPKPQEPKK